MTMQGLRVAAALVIATTTVGLAGCSAGGTETPSSTAAADTKGATTTAGPQGADGAPGATGPAGPEGPAGPAGPAGAAGATGATGPAGAGGAAGPKGVDGTDGAQGLPGAKGDTGSMGPNGATGANGANGANGAAGDAGLSSLVNVSNVSLGDSHCPGGGVKIEVGLDTNTSGTLDPSEVQHTTYSCQPVQRKRVVFVTSQTFDGDLGGIAGADAKCMAAAAAGAPSLASKTFRAWVSTSSSSPAASFPSDGAFVTVGGAVLADTFNNMRDGTIMAKVTTETGAFLSTPIWTGTTENGYNVTGWDCGGWTDASAASSAQRASSDVIQWYWSSYDTNTCDQLGSLYCIEQ
jgi:hypothetical protein